MTLSTSEESSPEVTPAKAKSPERTPRMPARHGGRRERRVVPKASKRNSSSSPARPMSSKGGSKAGKGKNKGWRRCENCWAKVSTQSKNALGQHQMWSQTCVAWQYHNRGLSWGVAQAKAQRKIERRQERSWARQEAEALGHAKEPADKASPRKPGARKTGTTVTRTLRVTGTGRDGAQKSGSEMTTRSSCGFQSSAEKGLCRDAWPCEKPKTAGCTALHACGTV